MSMDHSERTTADVKKHRLQFAEKLLKQSCTAKKILLFGETAIRQEALCILTIA